MEPVDPVSNDLGWPGGSVDDRYGAGRSLREGDVDGVVRAVRELRADAAAPGAARLAFEQAYCDVATLPQLDRVLDG